MNPIFCIHIFLFFLSKSYHGFLRIAEGYLPITFCITLLIISMTLILFMNAVLFTEPQRNKSNGGNVSGTWGPKIWTVLGNLSTRKCVMEIIANYHTPMWRSAIFLQVNTKYLVFCAHFAVLLTAVASRGKSG